MVTSSSLTRPPRFGVDGERWLRVHLAAMEGFALACTAPDGAGKTGRRVQPGDLVILNGSEDPRVRVVLEVRQGKDGGKVVIHAPDEEDGERSFVASRVATRPWDTSSASAVTAG